VKRLIHKIRFNEQKEPNQDVAKFAKPYLFLKKFLQATCITDDFKCARIYQRTLKENKENEWRIEKKALTEKLKTLSQYEADAKKSFQNGYG
jgi:hypothetical protein